jgi:hypothetical protein
MGDKKALFVTLVDCIPCFEAYTHTGISGDNCIVYVVYNAFIHQNAVLDPRATLSCVSSQTSWDMDDLEDFMPVRSS